MMLYFCKLHPKYKATREPTRACAGCWYVYLVLPSSENAATRTFRKLIAWRYVEIKEGT